MKKLAVITAALATIPMTANADLLFTVGADASIWHASPSGQVDKSVPVGSSGLDMDSDNGKQLTLFVETALPLVPNVKLKHTNLKMDGSGQIDHSFSFADQSFNQNVDLSSTLDLSHTDITAYWGLPLPIPKFRADLGLTARIFDGKATVTEDGSGTTKSADIDLTLPMAYGAVKVGPFFGAYAKADINWIGVGDNELTDISASVGYQYSIAIVDFGAEVGYRRLSLETDRSDVDVDADVDVDGMFYGLTASIGF